MITAAEFERQYAERSGITVERLRAMGRIVRPCNCGDPICEGWQSTYPETPLTPREREDEERRDAHDDARDPWGYDDPPQEPREESNDG